MALAIIESATASTVLGLNDFSGQPGSLGFTTVDPDGLITATTPELTFIGPGAVNQITALVTFDSIDVTAYRDVIVSFSIRSELTDGTFEPPDDFFTADVLTDVGTFAFPIALNASEIDPAGVNQIAIPDNATTVTLRIETSLSGVGERIFVDDVMITAVPEPTIPILSACVMSVAFCRRNRHSSQA